MPRVAPKAQTPIAKTLEKVRLQKKRVVLRHRGKRYAAVVPIEDLRRLEELEEFEDKQDAEVSMRRLADPNEKWIPFEKVRKEPGL